MSHLAIITQLHYCSPSNNTQKMSRERVAVGMRPMSPTLVARDNNTSIRILTGILVVCALLLVGLNELSNSMRDFYLQSSHSLQMVITVPSLDVYLFNSTEKTYNSGMTRHREIDENDDASGDKAPTKHFVVVANLSERTLIATAVNQSSARHQSASK